MAIWTKQSIWNFPGFEVTRYVCLLRKSIYGLKQASRVWAKRLQTSLQHHGFKELISDLCIYFKTTAAGLILIAIYVDDLLVAVKNENAAAEIKNTLAQEYMITDLGIVERYLGIEIEQDPNDK